MSFKPPIPVSKNLLLEGYQTLNQLWDRSLFPKDLELHYFLHWFAVYQGNLIQAPRSLQIHHDDLQNHFRQFGFPRKTYGLRYFWDALVEKNKYASFEANFYEFFSRFNGETEFTPEENKRLIQLWQSRFPFKTLLAHYALWAVREHKPKDWVLKKMNYSRRDHLRLLGSLLNTKARDGFWLAPLNPSPEEIQSHCRRNSA
jgi:hypothetical protein